MLIRGTWEGIISMTDSKTKLSELQLFFGEPLEYNGIKLYQPTIGDILEYDKKYGESEFWRVLNVFIGNPTMYRLMLWDLGIDWNKISDFELFATLVKNLEQKTTEILLGDLDFTKFEIYTKQSPPVLEINEETGEETVSVPEPTIVLYKPALLDEETETELEPEIEIDENTYNMIALYYRTIFNIFPKVEKAKGKTTKKWIIEEDRMNYNLHKNEETTSTLLPLISSCLNHSGFKYKKKELKNVGIYEFMDSVQRLQIYEQSTALLKGAYSGFMDSSKIPSEQFNFMREITHDKK